MSNTYSDFTSNSVPLIKAQQAIINRKWREGYEACLDALEQSPNHPYAYYLLGVVASETQNSTKAVEFFEKSISLEPENSIYYAALGKEFSNQGRNDNALSLAEKAISLGIDDVTTFDTIGIIFTRAGLHTRAIQFFTNAVSRNPKNANFQYNLGNSLQFSGDFDGAEKAYRKAMQIDPNQPRIIASLSTLKKNMFTHEERDELIERFEENSDNIENTLFIGHAIARSFEEEGQYETAFTWLKKAKYLKRKASSFQIDETKKYFEAAKQTSQDSTGNGTPSDQQIFIIGMPRTGTTLVDRILSAHPDVTSAGELTQFGHAVKVLSHTSSSITMSEETLRKASTLNPSELGQAYIDATKGLNLETARFTDKMPLNFFFAGLIHRALPNARIICLRRNPMDTCLSNYRQLFRVTNAYYDYVYDLESVGHYYLMFDELMTHWRNTLPSNRFMEVNYEDVVANIDQNARSMIDFCNLPWHDACLNFHENTAPVATASAVQVRQPLYNTSVNRWEKYGSALDPLKKILASVL